MEQTYTDTFSKSSPVIDKKPEQIIINRYLKGEGIGKHIDSTSAFDECIYSMSLGAPCTMIFRHKTDAELVTSLELKPGTLLIMKDDARYLYTHEIPPCS